MIRSRCPICSKGYEVAKIDDLPTFPFCSDRCRLVDLGRWLGDDYAVPERRNTDEVGDEDGVADEDEAE